MLYEPCASISASAQAPNGTRPGWFGGGTAPRRAARPGRRQSISRRHRRQPLPEPRRQGPHHRQRPPPQQADAALAKLQTYGWTDPNNNALHASHYRAADLYVAFGYVVAYGKFSVGDNVCGFSLANVDATGNRRARRWRRRRRSLFATANGIGGNGGVDVIYNDSVGGAKLYHVGASPSTGRMDGALDGELCLRNMVTGVDTRHRRAAHRHRARQQHSACAPA